MNLNLIPKSSEAGALVRLFITEIFMILTQIYHKNSFLFCLSASHDFVSFLLFFFCSLSIFFFVKLLVGYCLTCLGGCYVIAAKLLFHQSPTRHSDSMRDSVVSADNCRQHGDYAVYQLCSYCDAGKKQQGLHHYCPVCLATIQELCLVGG